MGRTYPRVERLLRFVHLVQGRAGITLADLVRTLETSERNVYRDLDTLRRSGFPIEHDPVIGGYRIARGFFMPPVELTFEESLALLVLMEHLPRDEQIPFVGVASRVVEKVRCQLPGPILAALEPLDGNIRVDLARGMADESPRDVYETVRHAIATRRQVRCEYQSNKEGAKPERFNFSPYTLWYCQRAWYAVGQRSDRDDVRFFKLNRFNGISLTPTPYHIPDNFDLTKTLGHRWRMRSGPRHDVAVRFKQPFAETASETRWHPTQQEAWSDDQQHVMLRFTVDGLDEISWWILGYTPACRLLNFSSILPRSPERGPIEADPEPRSKRRTRYPSALTRARPH